MVTVCVSWRQREGGSCNLKGGLDTQKWGVVLITAEGSSNLVTRAGG